MSVRFRTRAVRKDARASSPERAVRSRDATETVRAEEITARAAIRAAEIIIVRAATRVTEMETARVATRATAITTVRAVIREAEMETVRAATRATETETARVVIRATEITIARAATRATETETAREATRATVTTIVRAVTRAETTIVRVETEAAWAFRSRPSTHRLHRSSRIRSRARMLIRKSMTQRKTAISR